MALIIEEMSRGRSYLRRIFSAASGVVACATEEGEGRLVVFLSKSLPEEKKREVSGQIEGVIGRKFETGELKFLYI